MIEVISLKNNRYLKFLNTISRYLNVLQGNDQYRAVYICVSPNGSWSLALTWVRSELRSLAGLWRLLSMADRAELLQVAVEGFTANSQKSQLKQLTEQHSFLGNAVQPILKWIRWLSLRGTSLPINCRKSPDDWVKLDTQLSHRWHPMGCILSTLSLTKLQTVLVPYFFMCPSMMSFSGRNKSWEKYGCMFPSQCKSGSTRGMQCCVTQLFTFLGFRLHYFCSQWICTSVEKY